MTSDSSPHPIGLRTLIYKVADLARAKEWYASAFGVAPYFDEPYYVGFSIGGFELGLDPDVSDGAPRVGTGVAYWGVANAGASLAHFLSHGATERSAVREVGGGIRVATVDDPFGNTIGLIENPHFSTDAVR